MRKRRPAPAPGAMARGPDLRHFGVIRRAVFWWLNKTVARIRRPSGDILLDYLKPNGEVGRYVLDASAALHRSGRMDVAYTILDRGIRAYPEDLAIRHAAALLAYQRGHAPLAAAHWDATKGLAQDDPKLLVASAASLRLNRQASRASELIEDAISRFPGDLAVLLEGARTAMARGRYERASELWTEIIAKDARSSEAIQSKAEALRAFGDITGAEAVRVTARARVPGLVSANSLVSANGIHGEAVLGRTSHARNEENTDTLTEVIISPGDLMLEFESLGDNCEFGLAQRYCGVEPLGLFRYMGSHASNLNHAFATCFEEYGTEEDLCLEINPEDQEYRTSSRRYNDFQAHTEAYAPLADVVALRASQLRKLAYLKQRLLSDLRSGEKIFVRKQGHLPDAMNLSRTIRAMGPNIFLSIEVADDAHPIGHVEVLEPGLLRGYISKFAWYGNAHALELEDWLQICVNALNLAKASKGQQVRYRLPQNDVLQLGSCWDIWPRCHSSQTQEIRFEGRAVEKLTLLQNTERSDAIVALQKIETPVSSTSHTVFALWIWVPSTFQGTFIDVYFHNAPACFLKAASLDKRDVWQRIYTSVRMPKGETRAAVALRVTGCATDFFYLATWSLERGCVPNSWPRDPN